MDVVNGVEMRVCFMGIVLCNLVSLWEYEYGQNSEEWNLKSVPNATRISTFRRKQIKIGLVMMVQSRH
jgi:hypothetical protein